MNIDLAKLREKAEAITVAGEIERLIECDTPYNRFFETAAELSDNVAVKYMGNDIKYSEMLAIIDVMAKGFHELGVRKNDVVTVSLLGAPYAIAIFYALDKLGACQHMVNSSSGIDELKREFQNFDSKYFVANDIFCSDETLDMLKKIGVEKVIVTSLLDGMSKGLSTDKAKYTVIEKAKGIKSKLIDGKSIINCQQLIKLGESSYEEITPVPFEENHMAAVAYTSGSTGNSKACTATWRAMDSFIQVLGMTEVGRYNIGDVLFTTFPLWIFYSLLNMIHEPLCLGITVALDPLYEPDNLEKRNNQYQFNHWPTIPPYIAKMLQLNKNLDCSKWRVVSVGGVELKDEVKLGADEYINAHGGTAKIVQGYGASEVLGSFSYCYYDNPTLGSLGKPCIGNMFKFVDAETGKELENATEGLLYIYSPAMMSEYYGDEEATKQSLIKDENGVTWYNTEDIMRVNERGELFFVDRLRRLVMTIDLDKSPAKLIPSKTESCVASIPAVENCAVITVPDKERENIPIAFVQLKESNALTDEEIIRYCMNNISEYQVPKKVIFIDSIPLTSSQKPDYKSLEKQYKNL
ncbi:MAG: acyl--CoA ligase [Ruminococcaceae bacterium]|nr:acyl--CoA ligase [Oscillospiraceae bacterium]